MSRGSVWDGIGGVAGFDDLQGLEREDEEANGDGEDEEKPSELGGFVTDTEGAQAEADGDGGEGALEEEIKHEGTWGAVEGGVVRDEAGSVTNGQEEAGGGEDDRQPVGPCRRCHGGGGTQHPGAERQGGEGGDEGDEEVGGGHGGVGRGSGGVISK